MILQDSRQIGNMLLAVRKKQGMTQMEVAEAAGLSNRAYADIERGTANMRVDTLLRICLALHITPNDILTKENEKIDIRQEELLSRLEICSPKEKDTALQLLSVFLKSLT